MKNFISILWEIFLAKKTLTDKIITNNIDLTKKVLFSNQTADLKHLSKQNNSYFSQKIINLFLEHGYLTNRLLEFINYNELISNKFEDLPLIPEINEKDEKKGLLPLPNGELKELVDFIHKLRPLYREEIQILYLIAQLKSKIINIELDEEKKVIIFSPPTRNRDIQNSICFNLEIEKSKWNIIFSPISFPREGIVFSLGKGSGIGEVTENDLKANWDFFKLIWESRFKISLDIDSDRFFSLWRLVKKIEYNFPFLEFEKKISEEFVKLSGDEKNELSNILKAVLPNLKNIKMLKNINSITDGFFHRMYEFGIGWRYLVNNSKCFYHIPCEFTSHTFINKGFKEYFKALNSPGEFYERELKNRIEFLNKGYAFFRGNRNCILGCEPKILDPPEVSENPYKIKTLKTNYEIKIPKVAKYGISTDGEIDIIIYSNNNIFILEAKSFFGKTSSKDWQSASEQCTKYRKWIKTKDFKNLIENEFKIKSYRNIFILIITNRQENRLYVQCNKSKYFFPIISFTMLPLLLLGVYQTELPARNLIPNNILDIFINIVRFNFPNFEIYDNPETFEKFRFVWRKFLHIVLNSANLSKNFDFNDLFKHPFRAGYRVIDYAIGDPSKWELDENLLIGNIKGFNINLVTQINTINSKFVCTHCKNLWIYCYPSDDENREKYKILTKRKCLNCGKQLEESNTIGTLKLRQMAGILMIEKQREITEKILKIG